MVRSQDDDRAWAILTDPFCTLHMTPAQIEIIFTAPDEAYSVPTIEALKEATSMKPQMSKKAGEELINSLIRHGWLHRSE
jgi:hypothetical protein